MMTTTGMNGGMRGRVRLRCSSVLIALSVSWTTVLTNSVRAGVAEEIGDVLARLPHAQTKVSACVVELPSGRTVFAKNADQVLTPASCMKIFAMSAALANLGPNFEFETVLASDGRNLIVVGDGDPGFGDEKICQKRREGITAPFFRWANALRTAGITHVTGDLLIDESVFEADRIHPSWEPSDLDNWYAAPVGGLNLNDNCLDITVTPAKERGAPPLVDIQPPTSLARVVNAARSGLKGEPVLRHRYDTFEYVIGGQVPKRWRFGSVPFPDPGFLFADALRSVLAQSGIVVDGQIKSARLRLPGGALPATLRVIGTHRTPLVDALERAGKDSQNMFAECLLKRAGYAGSLRNHPAEATGSWATGRQVVMDLLRTAGVDSTGLQVADGSGLSRNNAASARQLTQLLAFNAMQPWADVFHDSLAQAGVDGSLRKRLRDSPGDVFAKTGTMRGVRALAGYVDGPEGPRFAFAVIFNGYPGTSAPYKSLQDRICRILQDAGNARAAKR